MATVRHLEHAPIREAVIDLRVTAPKFVTSLHLEPLRAAFASAFPHCEEQRSYESLIEISRMGVSHTGREAEQGYICRSEENHEAVIISGHGFSFSRLSPYTDWDSVIAEARRHWRSYVDHVAVERVTRVGVRFINRFTVPARRRIEDYLTSSPRLPNGFTAAELGSSVLRLVLRDERAGITSRVTQVVEPAESGFSVILDTDSFVLDETPASEEVWQRFSELRDVKNRIFFGSLTELALEDFE
jgi:uncharacterized protein (TIGR04255 family)